MDEKHLKFVNDQVEGWTPIQFAITFTRKLRGIKAISQPPSLRTTLAIPRFLTARYYRIHSLTPGDYIQAAVLNTPYEDQIIAEQIARELLFPQKKAEPKKQPDKTEPKQKETTEDTTASILDDLASLNIDFENLDDLSSLDELNKTSYDDAMQAFDVFEDLHASAWESDRSLAELASMFGGPAEMSASGITDIYKMRTYLQELLRGEIGDLTPKHVYHACRSGFSEMMQKEVKQPWELAGSLAGANNYEALKAHLDDLLESASCRDLGKTLQFLKPYQETQGTQGQAQGTQDQTQGTQDQTQDQTKGTQTKGKKNKGKSKKDKSQQSQGKQSQGDQGQSQGDQGQSQGNQGQNQDNQDQIIREFAEKLKNKPQNLSDFAEIANGLGEWFEPSQSLIKKSVKENILRSLSAANWIDQNFENANMSETVFDNWAQSLNKKTPSLDQLAEVIVNCKSWIDLANKAYKNYIKEINKQIQNLNQPDDSNDEINPIAKQIDKSIETASKLQKSDIYTAKKIASDLSTETMPLVNQKEQFLPVLDEFLDHKIIPSKIEKVVKAGTQLGVNPEEIYDRLGDNIEQLKQMILNNTTDAVDRYKMLVQKISHIEQGLFEDLTKQAVSDKNTEAMASMLAIDLNKASSLAPDDFVNDSLCYKGIGDGTNLLKQWFNSRGSLRPEIKDHVKAMAREALIELAFDWINKGTGSCDSGLIPQNNSRPFLSGDDIELLDIESTLDSIISSGKSLDSVTEEDLFVSDTSKGRAAMGVLIDISGSMGGNELSICAIAVVMMLGKLRSEEISIALFESDTHVLKSFNDMTDMDAVIDKVLDLQAMGGTRVDAALKWMNEEFETVTDTEYKILFLLSDFCFFERPEDLKNQCQLLADIGVKYIGASHGTSCTDSIQVFLDTIGGQSIELKSINALPGILLETFEQIGEGG